MLGCEPPGAPYPDPVLTAIAGSAPACDKDVEAPALDPAAH